MELFIAKQCSKAPCSDWSVHVNVKVTQLTVQEDIQWIMTKISELAVSQKQRVDDKRYLIF